MNGSRLIVSAAVTSVLLALAGLVLAEDKPDSKPASKPAPAARVQAAGRWNIIVDTGKGKQPSWLGVQAQDGKHIGRFLGGAGSVGDIGQVKIEDDKIEFQANDLKWTGTIKDDTITGTRVNNKGEQKGTWTAQRAVYKLDLSGRWFIKRPGVPISNPSELELSQDGSALSGRFKEGDQTVDLIEPRIIRELFLGFSVNLKSGRREYTGSVKGDAVEFIVSDGQRRYQGIGHRQRAWGEPIELFNGKDLSNWAPLDDPKNFQWKVIDGVMVNTGTGGSANIVSKDKFRDFKLHVEFKVPKEGNSGVYLRGRHEIQVADSFGSPPSWHDCGSLYSRIAPAVNACKKASEWQTFDVVLVGRYLTVVFNGELTIDNEEIEGITGGAIDSNETDPGPFYLQGDHGAISYRKITIWPAK